MIYGNEVDDRTLAAMAQAGDRLAESALGKRYSPLAEGLSRGYFLAGGDADDLKQIAMIALLEAVRSYDAGRGAEFSKRSADFAASGRRSCASTPTATTRPCAARSRAKGFIPAA